MCISKFSIQTLQATDSVTMVKKESCYLESLDTNLESIHSCDGCLGAAWIIKTHEPEALALVGGSVNEHLHVTEDDDDQLFAGDNHDHEVFTLELMTLPKGRNICMSSASPNS